MNEWVSPNSFIVEMGCGAGFSELYLADKVFRTDVVPNPWIDASMDAERLAFRDGAVDALIISNALHHLARPVIFFREAVRVLKPGGIILIYEPFCSLLLRVILRLSKHEGYSFDLDVFAETQIATNPNDPWSGNNALSNLFFDRPERFRKNFPELQIIMDTACECLLFPLSGGVTSKVSVPELPTLVLDCIAGIDRFLTHLAPRLFALGRRTVIRKIAG